MSTRFLEPKGGIAPEDTFTSTYSDLTAAGTWAKGDRISVVDSTEGLRVYYLYYFDNGDAVATAAGAPVGFNSGSSFDGGQVTSDYSASTSNLIAGISLSAVTDTYYAWFQTWGQYSAVLTNADDDVAIGGAVWWDGDNTTDVTATGTAPARRTVGFAISADVDASDTVEAYLNILR